MPTIINNPNPNQPAGPSGGGDNSGWFFGIIILIILVVLIIIGIPYLKRLANPVIDDPQRIDVNIEQEGQNDQNQEPNQPGTDRQQTQ